MIDITELYRLLNLHVKEFGTAEGLPVVWPNIEPETKHTTQHLIVRILPITPAPHTVCLDAVYEWILQVDVRIRDGKNLLNGVLTGGDSPATETIKKLIAHIPPLYIFAGADREYRVVRPAEPKPPLQTDGWYSIPVDFRIQTVT